MPVVPFIQQAAQTNALPGPAPDEQWTLMAAAQMHSEGRLIEPEAEFHQAAMMNKDVGKSDSPMPDDKVS